MHDPFADSPRSSASIKMRSVFCRSGSPPPTTMGGLRRRSSSFATSPGRSSGTQASKLSPAPPYPAAGLLEHAEGVEQDVAHQLGRPCVGLITAGVVGHPSWWRRTCRPAADRRRAAYRHGLIPFEFRLIICRMSSKAIVIYTVVVMALLALMVVLTSRGSWELGYL